MERHTLIGADVLRGSDSPVLMMAEEIALTHHERWDGLGYPNQLGRRVDPARRAHRCRRRRLRCAHPRASVQGGVVPGSSDRSRRCRERLPLRSRGGRGLQHTGSSVAVRSRPSGGDRPAAGRARRRYGGQAGVIRPVLGTVALGREINRARHGSGELVLGTIEVDGLGRLNEHSGRVTGRSPATTGGQRDPAAPALLRSGRSDGRKQSSSARWSKRRRRMSTAASRRFRPRSSDAQPGASISFGLAELRPGDSLEELIVRGETALYVSKERRRQVQDRLMRPGGAKHRSDDSDDPRRAPRSGGRRRSHRRAP